MQSLGARAKKTSSRTSHQHLVWTDFLRRCLGMSPKLPTARLPTVPRLCFSKMAAEDHIQISPVQFSYTKVLMKLEVNQRFHAFQEDFGI